VDLGGAGVFLRRKATAAGDLLLFAESGLFVLDFRFVRDRLDRLRDLFRRLLALRGGFAVPGFRLGAHCVSLGLPFQAAGRFGCFSSALAVKPRRAIGALFFFPHPQAIVREDRRSDG
jgi:hypothetical protein